MKLIENTFIWSMFLFLTSSPVSAGEVVRVGDLIAVLDLRTDETIPKNAGPTLTDAIINEAVQMRRYKVIDRANRDKILQEQPLRRAPGSWLRALLSIRSPTRSMVNTMTQFQREPRIVIRKT